MAFKFKGENTAEISFPLGGIGVGSVGLSGNGRLIDWEVFHRPNRRSFNAYTNFAIKAEADGEVLDARLCQGDCQSEFMGGAYAGFHSWGYGHGPNRTSCAGMEHFSDVEFEGKYPVATITYNDKRFPGNLTLEAFNPFIPSNDKDSSIPCAFFKWTVENTSNKEIEYTLGFSCGNLFANKSRNTFVSDDGLSSIHFTNEAYNEHQAHYGDIAITTDGDDVSYQEYWFRSGWFDDLTMFWNNFNAPGKIANRHYDTPGGVDMGTLCSSVKVLPGEKKSVDFVLSWYIPNVHKFWSWNPLTDEQKKNIEEKKWDEPMWKAYYAPFYSSSIDVARYCFDNKKRLYSETVMFRDALFGSSLPEPVIDAIQGTMAILKSSTCMRLENGEFYAFEGVNKDNGSCEGSCDHVWGYAYALPFLFPSLERSMRALDYTYNTTKTGEMRFRIMLPLGTHQSGFRACVDGQFGGVMKFYRDWKISGDDEWLKKYWGEVKKSIEYAWSPENYDKWDPNQTGVLTGRQHHTLDVELFGASSWLNGYYLGALLAGAEIAEYLGETETAEKYREIYKKGHEWTEKNLFNGKHYIQKIDVSDRSILEGLGDADSYYWNDETKEIKYQIGEGCEIDQVVAQWHAKLSGLGNVFDPENCATALKNLYRINFRKMRDTFNPCRVFAVDDEKGLMMCNWDEGTYKPKIPVPYTEEVMTGFEYAAGCAMLMYGMEEEAVNVVAAIRERYNGKRRNPWAEIECGASYARSMASYSYLLVFSGFEFDMPNKTIGFNPIHQKIGYKTFWAIDSTWGTFEITENGLKLNVLYGTLSLDKLNVPDKCKISTAKVDENIGISVNGRAVTFDETLTLTRGQTLILN